MIFVFALPDKVLREDGGTRTLLSMFKGKELPVLTSYWNVRNSDLTKAVSTDWFKG